MNTMQAIPVLKFTILSDPDGNRARIIGIRGSEVGLDHIEITTQSPQQKEAGVKSVRRIYAEEFPA